MPSATSSMKRVLTLWLGFALVLLIAPWVFTSNLSMTMLSQMGIAIIACLSYNLLLGQGGMLSFGHAVYSGMGSYLTIHALNAVGQGSLHLPVSLLPLIGGVAGMGFAVLLGFVTTRKSGTAFSMITLGMAELVFAMSLMFSEFFGGEAGVSANRVAGDTVFGISYGPQRQVYYLIAAYTFVSVALLYALTQTPLGRILNAVRDNPERVEFIGYNTQQVRYRAFIISGFFAGIAGGLGALNHRRSGRHGPFRRVFVVHLFRRCHFLFWPDSGRHIDGAGICALVRIDQGLAALPRSRVLVHGGLCAGWLGRADHGEFARHSAWCFLPFARRLRQLVCLQCADAGRCQCLD